MKKKLAIITLATTIALGAVTTAVLAEESDEPWKFGPHMMDKFEDFSFEDMLPFMKEMHPDFSEEELESMYQDCHNRGGANRSQMMSKYWD
ncbi:hypothetical protein EJF36_06455 [Bacillus sp. HMF5848]|uniref:CUE domain-containing protein n=1 Tax=Bacillus sp. HMF5848 TaxID=2495421 RepID=UPI000F771F4A|nr:CUE domain-containing protein [Bacillus sp. HMF5848]RSK26529.1 hypothetical protein EJF36_06455 [Bacillus sp. HMF5848]